MLYREGSKQANQGYVMAMQGVDRDRCQWRALPKCNLPQPSPPTYFWRASSGDVRNRSRSVDTVSKPLQLLPALACSRAVIMSIVLFKTELQHSSPSTHSCIPTLIQDVWQSRERSFLSAIP